MESGSIVPTKPVETQPAFLLRGKALQVRTYLLRTFRRSLWHKSCLTSQGFMGLQATGTTHGPHLLLQSGVPFRSALTAEIHSMLYMYMIYTFLSRLRPHRGRQLEVMRFPWKRAGLPSLVLLSTILCLVCLLGNNIAAAALPSGWTDVDIGSPGMAGSASYSAGNWTVSGGGC
jgi:hypothetical protein